MLCKYKLLSLLQTQNEGLTELRLLISTADFTAFESLYPCFTNPGFHKFEIKKKKITKWDSLVKALLSSHFFIFLDLLDRDRYL